MLPLQLVVLALLGAACSSEPKMPASVVAELDSLFVADSKHSFISFFRDVRTENFSLSAEEKMQGADFLLSPDRAGTLTSLRQKNVALMVYTVDRNIARLYDLSREEYDEQIAHLRMSLQLQDDNFLPISAAPMSNESLKASSEKMKETFKRELRSDRFDMFIVRVLALYTENVYILSQKPDVFLRQMSDTDAVIISERYAMFCSLLTVASMYYPELGSFNASIKQLQPLENVRTKEQLAIFLKDEKAAIGSFRNSLLE